MSRARNAVGWALAFAGVAVLGVELARYWLVDHPIHGWPVAIGCTIGFVGFYMLDSRRAEDAGAFIVNSAVAIIGVVRSGRRSTDVKIVATALETPPTAQRAVPTSKGDDVG